MAFDEGQIAPPDLPRLDPCGEPPVGLAAAGHDHEAGGVPVEAVNDPGPERILAAGHQIAERVDQRRSPVPRRGVHDEPGGLVDHREPAVEEDDAGLGGRRAHSRRTRS
jgi:hypothetical protein